MKNDKQIVFAEQNFQPVSGKSVTIIPKLILWNV